MCSSDLSSFRKFIKGIRVVPESSSTSSESGDLEVDSASGKLKYYNAAQTGVENSSVVTESHSATLSNKTIDTAATNTIKINGNTLSASAGTATVTIPNSTDTLVGRATSDTLTNKTFDAEGTGNSLSNVKDSNIKVGAAIARSKLAAGTASHVVINDAGGVLSSEAQLTIGRGGTGQATKTAAFDALSPTTNQGDLIYNDGKIGRAHV